MHAPKYFLVLMILILGASISFAQNIDEYAQTYLKKIHKPGSVEEFNPLFHLPPVNQDTTNACWSFATLSFLESEMQRLGRQPVKLSVMFPFFHVYVEKARYFVQTRGKSRFAPGDLFSGVVDMIRKYGIVPEEAYRGETRSCKTRNHTALEAELDTFMRRVKEYELWDEEFVLQKVRKILYKYLGVPPQEFVFNGKTYSPKSFSEEVVRLPWDDYLILTSFLYSPFGQFIELKVPDNWSHQKVYFNVPLDTWYSALKSAVKNGFSVAFDSDTGEPGRIGKYDACFVPEWDIPGRYISQQAREFRFKNGSTTDDHLMHIIGYKRIRGNDWFLVKDSWRTAWQGRHKGYYFFHGDYLRLKALAFMVHKDAVPGIAAQAEKSLH